MRRSRIDGLAPLGMRLTLFRALLICLPFVLGCAKAGPVGQQSSPCATPVETTRHELFLGLQLPDSSLIGDQEFDEFVAEVVNPLFQEGLTIIDAAGQYRLADGRKIEEPSKILLLIVFYLPTLVHH